MNDVYEMKVRRSEDYEGKGIDKKMALVLKRIKL